ncbi:MULTISPECIES: hypothetical protein [Pseudoalteromonas]|uniref:DUF2897 domain-containing protein n=1 Tax=Pseudoalteromonas aliena SW19 TaxID=1314866 RepID=A0ABR9E0G7_9GAMM|nr:MULTISPECIES: hypothetical protein [Pseudoalteromonas]MBB1384026.1 hypothetical protein [Pseudoalteromonas sp. SG45-5]MBB1392445.1 hypothetical protein [Pseudoalteromonas sp. SG44-4]MBB1448135.1 hypothetical protein [Pseudoalteromonas sp. SG41-6]MBE0360106.1 hypothetical protein [Pseudoalteromonas aliena SW19]
MSLNQFLITGFIALILGVLLCLMSTYVLDKLKKYFYKVTFKHEVLEPYTPTKNKKENN